MQLPQASSTGSLLELSFRRLYQKCSDSVQNAAQINQLDLLGTNPKFHAQVEKLQEMITEMQRSTHSNRIDEGLVAQYKEAVKKLSLHMSPIQTPSFMKINQIQEQVAQSIANGTSQTASQTNKFHKSQEAMREGLGLRQRTAISNSGESRQPVSVQESMQQDLIDDLSDLVSEMKTNVTMVNSNITQRGKLLDETHQKLDANVERAIQAKTTAGDISVQTSMGLCQRLKLVLLMLFILGVMTIFMVSNKVARRLLWLN